MPTSRSAGPLRPLRLAHRGDWRDAPENSPAALGAAMRVSGCDGVEFDVRLSSEGIPVLLHDATLTRVQGISREVDELDVEALVSYGVPTLAGALAALPPSAFLDVELKGEGHGAATAAALRAARGEAPARAVVSSFEAGTLRAMALHLPGWPRWLNADDLAPATLALASSLGCAAVAVEWRAIDGDAMARATAAGLAVAAWTVRRASDARRLAGIGVVALCVEDAALDGW